MILSGPEISKCVRSGKISITPFSESRVNPNSYNYRLGSELKVATLGSESVEFSEVDFPEDGLVLRPRTLYLGHTAEKIGSEEFAMSLIGRSSIGRLGLFLQVSANLGHTGSNHQWTLELYACRPIRVYPYMDIGQVSFWTNLGEIMRSPEYYALYSSPKAPRNFLSNEVTT